MAAYGATAPLPAQSGTTLGALGPALPRLGRIAEPAGIVDFLVPPPPTEDTTALADGAQGS